jgi:hypothetical protein
MKEVHGHSNLLDDPAVGTEDPVWFVAGLHSGTQISLCNCMQRCFIPLCMQLHKEICVPECNPATNQTGSSVPTAGSHMHISLHSEGLEWKGTCAVIQSYGLVL